MHSVCKHLEHNDVKFTAVSRAPLAKIDVFKARVVWGFDWVSSGASDFNHDYNVSFKEAQKASNQINCNFGEGPDGTVVLPALSAFYRHQDWQVYYT